MGSRLSSRPRSECPERRRSHPRSAPPGGIRRTARMRRTPRGDERPPESWLQGDRRPDILLSSRTGGSWRIASATLVTRHSPLADCACQWHLLAGTSSPLAHPRLSGGRHCSILLPFADAKLAAFLRQPVARKKRLFPYGRSDPSAWRFEGTVEFDRRSRRDRAVPSRGGPAPQAARLRRRSLRGLSLRRWGPEPA